MVVMGLDRQSSTQSRGNPPRIPDAGFGTGPVGLRVRPLDDTDMPAVEQHLLKLAPLDRPARFFGHTRDEMICTYVHRLDPFRMVLIDAFDFSERLVGLVEANPIAGTDCVEVGITVDAVFRRRGLGRYPARKRYVENDPTGQALPCGCTRRFSALRAIETAIIK